MGGSPGIQAEKITFKYLVDLYLIKELAHASPDPCMQLSYLIISYIISCSMCHYSSVWVRTSEINALHRFRMTARSHQQILEVYSMFSDIYEHIHILIPQWLFQFSADNGLSGGFCT